MTNYLVRGRRNPGTGRAVLTAGISNRTTPWAWASLPGLGTRNYENAYRYDPEDLPSAWCPWLASEHRPSLVCGQCGRSDAWHVYHLCEDYLDLAKRFAGNEGAR